MKRMCWQNAILALAAALSAVAVGLLYLFILLEGRLFWQQKGFPSFLFAARLGSDGCYVLPLLAGSLAVALVAVCIASPFALAVAAFASEYASPTARGVLEQALAFLSSIPAVVWGLAGLIFLVPRLAIFDAGFSLLTGAVSLAVLIFPTVARRAQAELLAVPKNCRAAAEALGATTWQTAKNIVLPQAKAGILAAVVLGLREALSDTMIVLMLTGNLAEIPRSLTSSVRTVTAAAALEQPGAAGLQRSAVFAACALLLLLTAVLTLLAKRLGRAA